ncbi:MAG: 50S ribosomal protein L11 methyltransferase [Clostridia bacterium]|nr:50S ribosomal protein L11 methyltransferase [Clostridia bacterium]
MESKEQKWVCIRAEAKREYLDEICAVMSMVTSQLMIEDYSDVEQTLDGVYGDLIDEKLLKADKTVAAVSVYVPASRQPTETVYALRSRFEELSLPVTLTSTSVDEEDWADSWKQYYKPIHTGKSLVIVPVWEKYEKKDDETVVLMDPGMAFGTGTHETTRLCASLLEKHLEKGDDMLDVGCGSGILAICASRLGARSCYACDIDETAVRIAGENARLNGTDNVKTGVSDLLSGVPEIPGGYDVICANIVSDIIIRMAADVGKYLAPDGKLIVSGIILERKNEVLEALGKAGLIETDGMEENGWYAGVLRKKK